MVTTVAIQFQLPFFMPGSSLHPKGTLSPLVSSGGIAEERLGEFVLLTPIGRRPHRRILYVNSYGGREVWEKIRTGQLPPHHLWGCLELVRLGYEVALAEPLKHFDFRRPLPHDLSLLSFVRGWLRPGDILYSAHTLLYWLPFLKHLGLARCHVVSLTYAREDLDFPGAHSAIIALTPAAAKKAAHIAPKAKVAHLGWGADLAFFPQLPYAPGWFLSCGKTHRDHYTLSRAAALSGLPLRIISPSMPADIRWPPTTTLDTGGQHDDTVSYDNLLRNFYARCSASLIILNEDPEERTAVGFTNLIEAMAMARPVIVTKTGALPGELDVEASKCGLFVPSKDPAALAAAITKIGTNPALAREWGENGRKLAETHYNIGRFAQDLHRLFLSL